MNFTYSFSSAWSKATWFHCAIVLIANVLLTVCNLIVGNRFNDTRSNRILKCMSIAQGILSCGTAIPIIPPSMAAVCTWLISCSSALMEYAPWILDTIRYRDVWERRDENKAKWENNLQFGAAETSKEEHDVELCPRPELEKCVVFLVPLFVLSLSGAFVLIQEKWIRICMVVGSRALPICAWLWAVFRVPKYYVLYGLFCHAKVTLAIVCFGCVIMAVGVAFLDTIEFYFVVCVCLPLETTLILCAPRLLNCLRDKLSSGARYSFGDVVLNASTFLIWMEHLNEHLATENMLFLLEVVYFKFRSLGSRSSLDSPRAGWCLHISEAFSQDKSWGPIEMRAAQLDDVHSEDHPLEFQPYNDTEMRTHIQDICKKYIGDEEEANLGAAGNFENEEKKLTINLSYGVRKSLCDLSKPVPNHDGLVDGESARASSLSKGGEEKLAKLSDNLSLSRSLMRIKKELSLTSRRSSFVVGVDMMDDSKIIQCDSVPPQAWDDATLRMDNVDDTKESSRVSLAEVHPNEQKKLFTLSRDEMLICFDEAAQDIQALLHPLFVQFRAEHPNLFE